jgi:hypothetical protein
MKSDTVPFGAKRADLLITIYMKLNNIFLYINLYVLCQVGLTLSAQLKGTY